MDDEFEDLLGEGDPAARDEDDDMLPSTPDPHELAPPTENELRLGRKVLNLEKERDSLASELQAMKARFPADSTTIPVPTFPAPSRTPSRTPSLVTIPHELLPTLSLLRSHIAELSRDNEALRYTFLGGPVASSSKVTADTPSTAPSATSTSPGEPQGLDLRSIAARVKELLRENEELGEMVLEVGRGRAEEWQKALDESKAVITSLDSDLAHHLTVVQSLRSELVAYKTHFGPLPPKNSKKEGESISSSSRDEGRAVDRGPRGAGRDARDQPRAPAVQGRPDLAVRGQGADRRQTQPPSRSGIETKDRRPDDPRRNAGSRSNGRKEEDREYKRRR